MDICWNSNCILDGDHAEHECRCGNTWSDSSDDIDIYLVMSEDGRIVKLFKNLLSAKDWVEQAVGSYYIVHSSWYTS